MVVMALYNQAGDRKVQIDRRDNGSFDTQAQAFREARGRVSWML